MAPSVLAWCASSLRLGVVADEAGVGWGTTQIQNVEMVLERGEKLELLVDKTDKLQHQVGTRGLDGCIGGRVRVSSCGDRVEASDQTVTLLSCT
jgi:hypothetical protein